VLDGVGLDVLIRGGVVHVHKAVSARQTRIFVVNELAQIDDSELTEMVPQIGRGGVQRKIGDKEFIVIVEWRTQHGILFWCRSRSRRRWWLCRHRRILRNSRGTS
jgi:antibiotic biosynthesis monooxygenase (ABM) superfamily enzyme